MLETFFVNPGLVAGAGLVGLPIVIHLIHRMRYKRVRWAAMEFLLDSQQRNKRRLLLEQLLLLLLRCLAILGIVLIVARPRLGESLGALLASAARTEHVVVLDDSYSMGQRIGSRSAFLAAVGEPERGGVIETLIRALAERSGNHTLTLSRTSQPQEPDLLSVRIDRNLLARSQKLLWSWKPTYLATKPSVGVAAALGLLEQSDAAGRVLHLISDFRAEDWRPNGELAALIKKLSEDGVNIDLVDMAPTAGANLGVENLSARLGSVAAGVPFEVEARVVNFSLEVKTNVDVAGFVDGKPLPVKRIERIEPGESEEVEFEVEFSAPGIHQIEVSLPSDVLGADNRRYLAINLRDRVGVLLVDGGGSQSDSEFLSLALAPGGRVRTGLEPVVRDTAYLASGSLEEYSVIFLLNVAHLEEPAAEALGEFVRRGGGLAIFLGDQVQRESYERLVGKENEFFFPVRLGNIREVSSSLETTGPDLVFQKHPVFRIFEGERNPFIEKVRIEKFFGAREDWKPGSNTKVIATYRDGSPLVLDSVLENGRVMTVLTTAGPDWNSWVRNPSYVVAMLEMHAYLAEPVRGGPRYEVGQPWELRFDSSSFRREVTFDLPNVQQRGSTSESAPPEVKVEAELAGLFCELVFDQTKKPGLYRMTRTRTEGSRETMARSYNVSPAEGDLAKIFRSQLADRLEGVRYRYHTADEFAGGLDEEGFEQRDWLIALLVSILICEQLLAYRLSFHWK